MVPSQHPSSPPRLGGYRTIASLYMLKVLVFQER